MRIPSVKRDDASDTTKNTHFIYKYKERISALDRYAFLVFIYLHTIRP